MSVHGFRPCPVWPLQGYCANVARTRSNASNRSDWEVSVGRLIKFVAVAFVILLAAVVIVPLVVLAGLFIWLKLTEESDEEVLELEQEMDAGVESSTV